MSRRQAPCFCAYFFYLSLLKKKKTNAMALETEKHNTKLLGESDSGKVLPPQKKRSENLPSAAALDYSTSTLPLWAPPPAPAPAPAPALPPAPTTTTRGVPTRTVKEAGAEGPAATGVGSPLPPPQRCQHYAGARQPGAHCQQLRLWARALPLPLPPPPPPPLPPPLRCH